MKTEHILSELTLGRNWKNCPGKNEPYLLLSSVQLDADPCVLPWLLGRSRQALQDSHCLSLPGKLQIEALLFLYQKISIPGSSYET